MDSRNARPGREDGPGGDRGSSEVSTLPNSFDTVTPVRILNAHFESAGDLITRHGKTRQIHTLDALQLAVALSIQQPAALTKGYCDIACSSLAVVSRAALRWIRKRCLSCWEVESPSLAAISPCCMERRPT